MSTVTVEKSQGKRSTYRSPAPALIWRFRNSRDNWKRKYQQVKADLNRTRRRLDRLKASQSKAPAQSQPVAPPPPRPQSPQVVAQILDEMRQIHRLIQEQREAREEAERQHRLAFEMLQKAQAFLAALPPELLASSPPPDSPTAEPLHCPSPPPHAAPLEPKKGARSF